MSSALSTFFSVRKIAFMVAALFVVVGCKSEKVAEVPEALKFDPVMERAVAELFDAALGEQTVASAERAILKNQDFIQKIYPAIAAGNIDRRALIHVVLSEKTITLDKGISVWMQADHNGDGVISQSEFLQSGNIIRPGNSSRQALFDTIDESQNRMIGERELRGFLFRKALDASGETQNNIQALSALFTFDSDQNNVLSQQELSTGLAALMNAHPGTNLGCSAPKPTASAQVLSLSAMSDGEPLGLQIGERDLSANVIYVFVEDDEQPIYIMGETSGDYIWMFSGATHRIEHFSASTRGSDDALGVLGLPSHALSLQSTGICRNVHAPANSISMSGSSQIGLPDGDVQALVQKHLDELMAYANADENLDLFAELNGQEFTGRAPNMSSWGTVASNMGGASSVEAAGLFCILFFLQVLRSVIFGYVKKHLLRIIVTAFIVSFIATIAMSIAQSNYIIGLFMTGFVLGAAATLVSVNQGIELIPVEFGVYFVLGCLMSLSAGEFNIRQLEIMLASFGFPITMSLAGFITIGIIAAIIIFAPVRLYFKARELQREEQEKVMRANGQSPARVKAKRNVQKTQRPSSGFQRRIDLATKG